MSALPLAFLKNNAGQSDFGIIDGPVRPMALAKLKPNRAPTHLPPQQFGFLRIRLNGREGFTFTCREPLTRHMARTLVLIIPISQVQMRLLWLLWLLLRRRLRLPRCTVGWPRKRCLCLRR